MLAFDVFFDTSGTENDEHVLTVVGVVAKFEDCVALESEWKDVAREFGITRLHMHEFAHRKAEFAGWGEDRRIALLTRLLAVANQRVAQVVVLGLELADYRAVDQDYQLTESFGGAYSLSQITAMLVAHAWICEAYNDAFMLHMLVEDGDSGQSAMMERLKDDDIFAPIQLTKRDTELGGWVLLQLADYVAYEYRKAHESEVLGNQPRVRGSFRAIRDTLPVTSYLIPIDLIEHIAARFNIPKR